VFGSTKLPLTTDRIGSTYYFAPPTRRHHWIPESYLGLFIRKGNTGSQVFVVDCVERKSFWTSTDNVCVQRDFNRIESPDLDRNELEMRLDQLACLEERQGKGVPKGVPNRNSQHA
jgi:hypothetical protein